MAIFDALQGAGIGVPGDLLQYDDKGVPRPTSKLPSGLPISGAERLVKFALSGVHAGVKGLVNPFGVDVLIMRAVLLTTAVSSGACTLDIGTTPTSIVTASDNLMDGMNTALTAPIAQSRLAGDGTTNSKDSQYWAAGTWVTVSETTGDATGFIGTLYLVILP